MLRFTQSKQAANRDVGGRSGSSHSISYLMLSVEGSLELRYLGIGRAGHTRLATWGREHGTAPLSPDTDRTGSRRTYNPSLVASLYIEQFRPGESEPWPGFRGKGNSGVPQLLYEQTNKLGNWALLNI